MYQLITTTAASSEPVTTAELKAELRLNTNAEDTLLALKLAAARLMFEKLTAGRVVMPTSFRQHVSHFSDTLYLMAGNISAVSATKYYDTDNTLTTVDSGDVTADLFSCPCPVYMLNGYPAVHGDRAFPAYVEFTAGWANANAVPADVKLAILGYAAHLYRDREANLPIPQGFIDACQMYHTGLTGDWNN